MVEASKVINKVARETGFPYIPDHLGKWGRSVWGGGGGSAYLRGAVV